MKSAVIPFSFPTPFLPINHARIPHDVHVADDQHKAFELFETFPKDMASPGVQDARGICTVSIGVYTGPADTFEGMLKAAED